MDGSPKSNRRTDPVVLKARSGCRKAQDELVRIFGGDLQRHLGRLMGDKVRRQWSVSDLSQETFVVVFKSLQENDSGPRNLVDFKRRLFKNARWVVLKKVETASRFVGESVLSMELTDVDGQLQVGVQGSENSTSLEAADENTLREFLNCLDARSAEVVRRRLERQSYKEISVAMGERAATLRKIYERSIRKLERALSTKEG